ncbi:MAG: MBL fold metallo-hydrolase, partial [Geminicoccaceae bacterium]
MCWLERLRGHVIENALMPLLLLVTGAVAAIAPAAASAQCLPMVQNEPRVVPAALPAAGDVRLTYLGHSSFLIESAGGATAVTDYNGVHRAPFAPDIVTMNNAHSTHYSHIIEPDVTHVLKGWGEDGRFAVHDLRFEDMHIRNVPTNVRDFGGTRYNGNSIFVFELADLCIAHLGHLHHTLSDQHLGELGLIDVLLVPIDGVYTIPQELMLEVIRQIGASIVIPMHYFSTHGVDRFVSLMAGRYEALYSDIIEPDVIHVLKGWGEDGRFAVHDLRFEDMHIRNVPTNVRDFGGTRYNGN